MSYSSEVLTDSPLLYWRFEETSGTSAADSSGNGKTGTYVSSPTLGATGLISDGVAVGLNGSGQYVYGPASETTTSTTQFSAEAWFKTTSSSAMLVGMRQIGSGRLLQRRSYGVSKTIAGELLSPCCEVSCGRLVRSCQSAVSSA